MPENLDQMSREVALAYLARECQIVQSEMDTLGYDCFEMGVFADVGSIGVAIACAKISQEVSRSGERGHDATFTGLVVGSIVCQRVVHREPVYCFALNLFANRDPEQLRELFDLIALGDDIEGIYDDLPMPTDLYADDSDILDYLMAMNVALYVGLKTEIDPDYATEYDAMRLWVDSTTAKLVQFVVQ